MSSPQIEIIHADVTTVDADVLVLKYARAFHGADRAIASLIPQLNKGLKLTEGQHAAFDGGLRIRPSQVLFLGVTDLRHFDYAAIREFGRDAILLVAKQYPGARTVAMTIHGVGYGLDEREAFNAQVAGFLEAIESRQTGQIQSIRITERNPNRVERLAALLRIIVTPPSIQQTAPRNKLSTTIDAGISSEAKRHVFVAMPFGKDMSDVYDFGIKEPVNEAGLLCERVDMTVFTGDILHRIKERIDTASLIIADLTGANPNVYLEVGYAWGKARRTVLIVNKKDKLKFDVQGQRCLKYQSIKELRQHMCANLLELTSGT